MRPSSSDSYALFDAASRGDASTCVALLSLGAKAAAPGAGGCTPLMAACDAGHAEAAKALLGASDALAVDAEGWCALAYCARSGSLDCIAAILPHSDPTLATDNGYTALAIASMLGRHEAVRSLLSSCDPDQADCSGWTPLMHAISESHVDCARLLAARAAPAARTLSGTTALMLAAKAGEAALVDILLPMGNAMERNAENLRAQDFAALFPDIAKRIGDYVSSQEEREQLLDASAALPKDSALRHARLRAKSL